MICCLDLKILGGIKAGITEFIFPFENQACFDKFMEKNREKEVIRNIRFHSVKHIREVFELILESEVSLQEKKFV